MYRLIQNFFFFLKAKFFGTRLGSVALIDAKIKNLHNEEWNGDSYTGHPPLLIEGSDRFLSLLFPFGISPGPLNWTFKIPNLRGTHQDIHGAASVRYLNPADKLKGPHRVISYSNLEVSLTLLSQT
jgi:hypothetical protein